MKEGLFRERGPGNNFSSEPAAYTVSLSKLTMIMERVVASFLPAVRLYFLRDWLRYGVDRSHQLPYFSSSLLKWCEKERPENPLQMALIKRWPLPEERDIIEKSKKQIRNIHTFKHLTGMTYVVLAFVHPNIITKRLQLAKARKFRSMPKVHAVRRWIQVLVKNTIFRSWYGSH